MKHEKRSANTGRALLASLLSMLVCVSLLLGSTFAWFTDSVTNTGNKVEAGNLRIEATGLHWNTTLDQWGAETSLEQALIQEDKWEPGRYNAVLIKVSNAHDPADDYLAAAVGLDFEITAGNDAASKNLSDALWYKLTAFGPETSGDANKTVPKSALGFLDAAGRPASADPEVTKMRMIETDGTDAITVYPDAAGGQYAYYLLEYGMYTDAENDCQGGHFALNISVNATQAPVETDGFGNSRYDAAAASSITVTPGQNATAAQNGAALREALAEVEEGGMVIVKAGTYDVTGTSGTAQGGMVITTPGITIVGEPGAVIQAKTNGGGGTTGEINQQNTLTISADNVTLDGLTFLPIEMTNAGNGIAPKALEVTNAVTTFTLKNCTFQAMQMSASLTTNTGKTQAEAFGGQYGGQVSINTSANSAKETVQILNNTFNYAVLDLRTPATIEGNTFHSGSGVYHAAAIRFRPQFDGSGNNKMYARSDIVLQNNRFNDFTSAPELNREPYAVIASQALHLDFSDVLGNGQKIGNENGSWIVDETSAYWYDAFPIR